MSSIKIGDDHWMSDYAHNALLEVGDKYGIPRKDAEDLFLAVSAAASFESCDWDFIDGVEAILKAGFRRPHNQ